MDLGALFHRLDVTRALLESAVPAPGVIAITSAASGDGKTLVATGLAHNLAGVGHDVLLVDGNGSLAAGGVHGAKSAPKLGLPPFDILQFVVPGGPGRPSTLSLSAQGVLRSCSIELVQATFARFREHFSYTILDTAVLVESGMAVALATESNGVVIALKQGRAALQVDRECVKILRSAKVPILGVVTTHATFLRAFRMQQLSGGLTSGARLSEVGDTSLTAGSLRARVG